MELDFCRATGCFYGLCVPQIDVPADKIVDFEAALHANFVESASDLAQKINDTGDYNDEIETELKKFVEDFKATGTY